MNVDEWRAQVAAARPPLTAAREAILRQLLTPSKTTAPAGTGAADPDNERRINDERTAV